MTVKKIGKLPEIKYFLVFELSLTRLLHFGVVKVGVGDQICHRFCDGYDTLSSLTVPRWLTSVSC
jgi:hypothetical protein